MMVLKRCAMITAVRPFRMSLMAAMMLLSDCVSSAEVASSNTSRRGIVVQRPGDAQALDLPAGQAHAALAHDLLVAERHLG